MGDLNEQQATGKRIVVGVDGSRASRGALRWALREAQLHGSRVEVVFAWRPSSTVAAPAMRPPVSTRTIAEQQVDARTRLEHILRSETDGEPVPVRGTAAQGPANRVLVDASASADMLVIGGRTGHLHSKLPWATGQQVIRDASCPVVVVPLGG